MRLKEEADRHFFSATFHFHHGGFEETTKLCTRAVETFAKHKRAFLLRAQSHCKLERWEEAIDDANAAIGLGHREGHKTRGEVHLRRGAFREAISDLNVAVRIEPGDRKAWSLRSEAHLGAGNASRAAEDAAEANRVDPDSEAGLCVVCIDEPRATRLNPCEHFALCAECARECQTHHGTCPICNTVIKAIEYGEFMATFAPADAELNFDRLASAIKKARDDYPTGTRREMATLNPIGEGSGEGRALGDGENGDAPPRPETPDPTPSRDFSGYVVGEGMENESAERSAPATPLLGLGVPGFGENAAGLGGLASPAPMGGSGGEAIDDDEDEDEDEASEDDGDADAPDTPPR